MPATDGDGEEPPLSPRSSGAADTPDTPDSGSGAAAGAEPGAAAPKPARMRKPSNKAPPQAVLRRPSSSLLLAKAGVPSQSGNPDAARKAAEARLLATTTLAEGGKVISQDIFMRTILQPGASQRPVSELFNFYRPRKRPRSTTSSILAKLSETQHDVMYALAGCCDVVSTMSKVDKAVRQALSSVYHIDKVNFNTWFKNRRQVLPKRAEDAAGSKEETHAPEAEVGNEGADATAMEGEEADDVLLDLDGLGDGLRQHAAGPAGATAMSGGWGSDSQHASEGDHSIGSPHGHIRLPPSSQQQQGLQGLRQLHSAPALMLAGMPQLMYPFDRPGVATSPSTVAARHGSASLRYSPAYGSYTEAGYRIAGNALPGGGGPGAKPAVQFSRGAIASMATAAAAAAAAASGLLAADEQASYLQHQHQEQPQQQGPPRQPWWQRHQSHPSAAGGSDAAAGRAHAQFGGYNPGWAPADAIGSGALGQGSSAVGGQRQGMIKSEPIGTVPNAGMPLVIRTHAPGHRASCGGGAMLPSRSDMQRTMSCGGGGGGGGAAVEPLLAHGPLRDMQQELQHWDMKHEAQWRWGPTQGQGQGSRSPSSAELGSPGPLASNDQDTPMGDEDTQLMMAPSPYSDAPSAAGRHTAANTTMAGRHYGSATSHASAPGHANHAVAHGAGYGQSAAFPGREAGFGPTRQHHGRGFPLGVVHAHPHAHGPSVLPGTHSSVAMGYPVRPKESNGQWAYTQHAHAHHAQPAQYAHDCPMGLPYVPEVSSMAEGGEHAGAPVGYPARRSSHSHSSHYHPYFRPRQYEECVGGGLGPSGSQFDGQEAVACMGRGGSGKGMPGAQAPRSHSYSPAQAHPPLSVSRSLPACSRGSGGGSDGGGGGGGGGGSVGGPFGAAAGGCNGLPPGFDPSFETRPSQHSGPPQPQPQYHQSMGQRAMSVPVPVSTRRPSDDGGAAACDLSALDFLDELLMDQGEEDSDEAAAPQLRGLSMGGAQGGGMQQQAKMLTVRGRA